MASAPASFPATAKPPKGSRGINGLLAAFVCVLAFLLASTPPRNSDLWLHLASGRAWVQGQSSQGTDPFSSTTAGVYWVNPTWLSDVLFYALHQQFGERALGIAKAVLLTLLAALLLCFRLRRPSWTLMFLVAVAALLAAAPWLTLQPALLSLLGIMLTLYLLERPCLVDETAAERARKQWWLLVPLFALWANLDGWFMLGPLTVGLYALGEAVSGGMSRSTPQRSAGRILLLVALVGFAACLCNPYFERIFAWPTPLGLSPAERAWRHDPLGRDLVVSSFGARFAASPIFTSPGAWAYYLLLVGGALSFVLAARTLQPGRLLVWLMLAALSIYQASTIPFFAFAGSALLALNLQEWLRVRAFPEVAPRLRIALRGTCVLLGLVLLVLAWPGWLQPAPYRPRGWTEEPDGSLVRMAEYLKRCHDEGRFPSDRFVLNFSPEVAPYLAWFCPAEKGFVDARWPLFADVLDDFVHMRRDLLQPDDAAAGRDLRKRLDAHQLDRILLYDPDSERTAQAYRRLFLSTNEWNLLAIEGGAALFARRDGSISSSDVFDYRRAAYRPSTDRQAPQTVPRPPRPPSLLTAFTRRDDSRSPDRKEAALHVLSFDLHLQTEAVVWLATWATGIIGCGAGTEPVSDATVLAVRFQFAPPFLSSAPEPLYLAIRAARRALNVNPDDAGAFLSLGEAYVRLARQTTEQSWQTRLASLPTLRIVQAVTALEQAVLLQPDLDSAHALLAQLYFESEQRDRALDHLRARLRIAEQAVRRGGADRRSALERRDALKADVEKMAERVSQDEKIYQANTANKTEPSLVLERARVAKRHGLTRKALELLLASYPAIFGKDGVAMQLDLMLNAGRAYEVRAWLMPEHEEELGFSLYHGIMAQAAAACGDYVAADAELEKSSDIVRRVGISKDLLVPVRSALASAVVRALLMRPQLAEGGAGAATALHLQAEAFRPLGELAALMRQEADALVLRGLLALEGDDTAKALQLLRTAGNVWHSEAAAADGSGLDFPARPIVQQVLRRAESSR